MKKNKPKEIRGWMYTWKNGDWYVTCSRIEQKTLLRQFKLKENEVRIIPIKKKK